jgi:hypothetical protein
MFYRGSGRRPHFPEHTTSITIPPPLDPALLGADGRQQIPSIILFPTAYKSDTVESTGIDWNQAAFGRQHRPADVKGHLPIFPLPPRRPGSSRVFRTQVVVWGNFEQLLQQIVLVVKRRKEGGRNVVSRQAFIVLMIDVRISLILDPLFKTTTTKRSQYHIGQMC